MELLIIVSLIFFIAHIIEMRKEERKNLYKGEEAKATVETIWKATDMTFVPEDRRTQYRAYLKSDRWKVLRVIVLKRDSHRCVRCGYIGYLQVHHTNYRGIYENFDFSTHQLESVCADGANSCHSRIHRGELPMKKPL